MSLEYLKSEYGIGQTELVTLALDRLANGTRIARMSVTPSPKAIDGLTSQRDEIVAALQNNPARAMLLGVHSAGNVITYLHWLSKELGMPMPQLLGMAAPVLVSPEGVESFL